MKKLAGFVAIFLAGALTTHLMHAITDPREALMQADRDFDKATAAKGVDGWVSFFAEDGKMYGRGGDLVTGRAGIRELMAPRFADPKATLRWEPTFAAVSKSGDLGYTTGKSKGRTVEDGKLMEREGRYLSIWRKQKDGSWKVEIDHGNAGPPRPVE